MKNGVEVAREVLNKGWGAFNTNTMAFYSEDTLNGQPVLVNIMARQAGEGYGHVAAHKFLQSVGKGNCFHATTRTIPHGVNLFDKLLQEGVIQAVPKQHEDDWDQFRVIEDPMRNLRKYVAQEFWKEQPKHDEIVQQNLKYYAQKPSSPGRSSDKYKVLKLQAEKLQKLKKHPSVQNTRNKLSALHPSSMMRKLRDKVKGLQL